MTLEVYDKDDNLFVKIDDDDKTLESYNVEDGMRIHVSFESVNVNEVAKYFYKQLILLLKII